jgi:alanyl aminopeptidase
MSSMRLGMIACAFAACTVSTPTPPTRVATRVVAPAPRPHRPPPPSPGFRIPRAFVPSSYRARLSIDDDATTFEGAIEIDGALAEPAPVVWLHADGLAIEHAVATRGALSIDLDAGLVAPDYVALVPERPLEPGTWALRVAYRGAIANQALGTRTTDVAYGAFREIVFNEPYAFTMFEPTGARRVFPCLDEPDDKVPWQLTLDVRRDFVAASNTPIARETVLDARRKRVAFAPTRPLPSYLVAFAVGPFDVVDAGAAGSGVPIRILAQHGARAQVAWAAATLPRVLDLVEDFVGVPYPYGKLDVVLAPQGGAWWGAMENAGLITAVTLVATQTDTAEHRRWWVETMAHELAHHYFGDLVTPAWWDDVWLNEGFATWAAAKVAARFEPRWHGELPRYGRGAARVRAPQMDTHDRDRLQPYMDGHRGADVLRMLEAFVGDDAFLAGVRAFLAAHADGNATTADLVVALDAASGRKLDAIVADAIDQPNAPIVTTTLDCRRAPTLHLSVSMSSWTLPVCFAFDRDGARADACVVIADGKAELALGARRCPRWIVPNRDGSKVYAARWTPEQATQVIDRAWPLLAPHERAAALDAMKASIDDGAFWIAASLRLIDADDVASRTFVARELAALSRFVPDDLRPRFDAWIARRFATRARAVHFRAPPDADDATVELAAAEVALVATTDDRELAKEAVELVRAGTVDPPFMESEWRLAARADVHTAEAILELARRSEGWGHQRYIAALAAEGALLDWFAAHPELLADLASSDRFALVAGACSPTRRRLAIAAARDFLALDRDRALAAIDACIATRKRLEPAFRRALGRL